MALLQVKIIDRASAGVTLACLRPQLRAQLSTVHTEHNDRHAACLPPTTTLVIAARPRTPSRHPAVHRAAAIITRGGLVQCWTLSAMLRRPQLVARAALGPMATRLTACAPVTPSRRHTRHGARMRIAWLRLRNIRAYVAALCCSLHHAASTCATAPITLLRAATPFTPCCDLTVNGTNTGITHCCARQCWACLATKLSWFEPAKAPLLCACAHATRDGATRPRAPL